MFQLHQPPPSVHAMSLQTETSTNKGEIQKARLICLYLVTPEMHATKKPPKPFSRMFYSDSVHTDSLQISAWSGGLCTLRAARAFPGKEQACAPGAVQASQLIQAHPIGQGERKHTICFARIAGIRTKTRGGDKAEKRATY